MLKSPIPINETLRLQALYALDILDTPAEERFDRLTRIAQYSLQAPIVLVNLVDAERVWFKSIQGLEFTESPREISFCGHAILEPEALVVQDTLADPRFSDNPLVLETPLIRFYAGVPLTLSNGLAVGSLCVLDHQPRQLSIEQLALLSDLAQCVIEELERVRQQPQLTEMALAQARYAAIINSSDDAIMSKTLDGIITSYNPAAEKLFGYTAQEAVGQPMSMLIPPERADEEGLNLSRIGHGERIDHFETVRIRKDGSPVEVSVRISPIKDAAGEIDGASLIIHDISARKRREQDFAKISRFNQAVIDGADHLIITADARGIILSFNRAAEASLGYSAEESVGKLSPALFHDGDEIARRAQELTAAGKPVEPGFEVLVKLARSQNGGDTREWTYVRKDGTRFPVSLTVSALRDASGAITAFLGIATDISERRQAAQAQRENEIRLRAILDNILDGIITIGERGIVESFNKSAEKIFGYAADEVIGNNVRMLMPDSSRSDQDGYPHHFITSSKKKIIGMDGELLGRRKDGSTFPMELAVSEMRLADTWMSTGIVRDISERKQVERMKREFVSTVSHELRTPLTSIRGALGLVIGKFSDSLPAKALQLLETANRNSERLTLLINDILDLEKIESGRLEFEFKAVDLVDIAGQAIIANESYGQQHQVHLRLAEAPQSAIIWADEHRLLQVFSNLISNAVKFSPAGGTVDIMVHRRDNRFRISVKDKGRGIPAGFRHHIFQRFAQADSSDTRQKGGTGLGLSITKAIVERHGGNINFLSEEGAGSEFFFDLPEWLEVIEQAQTADNRPHMLICEDNPDVAMVLAELLAHEEVASDRVGTAGAALDILKRKRYCGMLLDLGLPDMDGLALIQCLYDNEATRDLPIIVVTGRTREDSGAWNGEVLSVVDWLQKPVDRERLGLALKQIMYPYTRPRILHVEDDIDFLQVTEAILADDSDYIYATSLAAARDELGRNDYDLILLDLSLPDGSGLDLLDVINPETKVIVFSGQDADKIPKEQVSAALTKAKTSNKQLLATIRRVINQKTN